MQPATVRMFIKYQEAHNRASTAFNLYMDARHAAAWAPFRRYTETNPVEHLHREWQEAVAARDDAYREWRKATLSDINTTILELRPSQNRRLTLLPSRVS